jgi:hypothetical protein
MFLMTKLAQDSYAQLIGTVNYSAPSILSCGEWSTS